MASERHDFRYVPCLSSVDGEPWDGERGRVTEVLARVVSQSDGWHAYLCGQDAMVRDGLEALGRLGFRPEASSYETYVT